jgi:broad specificity phosphatase PhoE
MREWWTRHDEEIEGGETNRQMYTRIAAFLDALRADPPADSILLVSHGGTINMALGHLAGQTIESMEWRRVTNCEVTTVSC